MREIKPTNEREIYILEDKDFLLIEAIRELTHAIRMGNKNGR